MTNRTMFHLSTSRLSGKAAVTAAFLTGTVAAGSIASASEPTAEELLTQIETLQKQVEKLQKSEAQAPEAGALERVLEDTETRSASFLQVGDNPDPFMAGHDGQFVLRSADGNFELNPTFQLQVRHVASLAPDASTSDDGDLDAFDDLDFGFEVRRFKVGFKGHAFSPDLTYKFQFGFARDEGVAVLEDAYIDYTPETGLFGNEDLGLRIGQYKDPTFFEESTSSSRQLAADRSLVNEAIGGGLTDRVQGVGIIYKGDKAKALVAYVDGANTDNTDFRDPASTDFRGGFSGRVDLVVMGEDDRPFRDFTALGTEEDVARVGFGAFLDLADADDFAYNLLHTADVSYETAGGLGLFAAYYGQAYDSGTDLEGADGYNAGGEIQVSQLLDKENGWEVFGRYDFIVFEEETVAGEDFYHEIVAGVNKYWESHKVKMTLDVGYLPGGNPGSFTGLGYRPAATDEGQLSIRGQFQLLL